MKKRKHCILCGRRVFWFRGRAMHLDPELIKIRPWVGVPWNA